ncbi:HAMP domain-containing histidine kinase [Blastopirellula sp. JC732]|uniref:histidine kinase n=1 Tax=Blastopirellula sediminis TaxID=2894196 RepID=A0A9X1MQS0_9BACT|nr:HAMP domain-containing sensor histidine kinase [Blastopirellula sediminis]MCC9605979.1 HAMP domain-containing histidine kinase [Blastopirellula sediminis]MCC9630722.1 HAMP domain-containing histidine kinase [Blastopirellula sediminis]
MDSQVEKPEENAIPRLHLDKYGWGAFAVFFLLATISAWFTWRYQESRRTILFLEYSRSLEQVVQRQFDDIRSAADRAQTLFVSSQVVEKGEWEIFVSRMRQGEKYAVVDQLFFADRDASNEQGPWRIILTEPNGQLAVHEGTAIEEKSLLSETLDAAIQTSDLTVDVIPANVQTPLPGPGLIACFPVATTATDGVMHHVGCVVAYSSEASLEKSIAAKMPNHFVVRVYAASPRSPKLEIIGLKSSDGDVSDNFSRTSLQMIDFDGLPMQVELATTRKFASAGLYSTPAIVFTSLIALGLICGGTISYIIDSRRKVESLLRQVESRNAELERFTYTVSHDLKSPLITIRGFVGALREDLNRGDQKAIHEDMEFIASGCSSMSSLLDDLLELSRIGRVVNPTEICQVRRLLDDAIRRLDLASPDRGINLQINGEPVELEGDRVRLIEAFQNLLDNAAKFANPDKPEITVSWIAASSQLRMTFADNGPGVPPAFHEKVFGLFEKLNPNSEGTGIGLAIVRRIIEHHHGRIFMEPSRTGARFVIELPLRQPT